MFSNHLIDHDQKVVDPSFSRKTIRIEHYDIGLVPAGRSRDGDIATDAAECLQSEHYDANPSRNAYDPNENPAVGSRKRSITPSQSRDRARCLGTFRARPDRRQPLARASRSDRRTDPVTGEDSRQCPSTPQNGYLAETTRREEMDADRTEVEWVAAIDDDVARYWEFGRPARE